MSPQYDSAILPVVSIFARSLLSILVSILRSSSFLQQR